MRRPIGRTDAKRRPTTGFRVWIGTCVDWEPDRGSDHPAEVIALEPAEDVLLSARQAAHYVEAFNRTAKERRLGIWAIAVPVVTRYEGDPQPGQRFPVPG